MKRAYNANISPGFTPSMCSFLVWNAPSRDIPVALVYDPANPARCQIMFATDEIASGGGTLTVWATGAQAFQLSCNVPVTSENGIELGTSIELKAGSSPFPQGVVNRGPLPPYPQPINYGTDLWFQPPADAQKRYFRCNFGCVTIPGLPWVPGMEAKNFDRLLTGFHGRYDPTWQAVIATTYMQRGYTHYLRWVQDEQNYPGYSIEKYVDECLALKSAGVTYIVHSFLSKDFAPHNPSVEYCRETFGPLIAALKAANCLDLCIVGFELNLVSDGSLFDLIDYFTVEEGLNEANGVPAYVHFISGYTWPGQGAPDRRQWWNAQIGKLTGLCYQCDPEWSYRDMQDRIGDTTNNSGEGFVGTDSGFGHAFDMIPLEPELTKAFGDGATLDENDLDQCGYVLLCTPGGIPCMGFGNGGRRPDGSYL